jgi:hypothetical protein
MNKENSAAICIVIGVIVVLAVGFSFPPIIARGVQTATGPEVQRVAKEEHSYCRSNLSDVNCICFARKAAHILIQDRPKIPGFVYSDRAELARGQATHTC